MKAGIIKPLTVSFLFLTIPRLVWAGSPDPETLLRQALGPVSVNYTGRLSVTQWYADRSTSEDVNIVVSKSGPYRREFLRPDGTVDRILVSDGQVERLYLPKQHLVLTGYPLDKQNKLITPEAEITLLLTNYHPQIMGTESVAGRMAWRLELNSTIEGKPKQRFWIDQETGVILQSMRIQKQGQIVTRMRYIRFEPQDESQPSDFNLSVDSRARVEEHGLDPDYWNASELRDEAKYKLAIPEQLPGHFMFESGDSFDLKSQPVLYLRYTDGLTIVSIFRTLRPVAASPKSEIRSRGTSEMKSVLGTSSAGHIVQWKTGKYHFTLIGDLSYDLLRQIQSAIKSAKP